MSQEGKKPAECTILDASLRERVYVKDAANAFIFVVVIVAKVQVRAHIEKSEAGCCSSIALARNKLLAPIEEPLHMLPALALQPYGRGAHWR